YRWSASASSLSCRATRLLSDSPRRAATIFACRMVASSSWMVRLRFAIATVYDVEHVISTRNPLARLIGDLLAGLDGDREAVPGRRERARRELGVRTRQVGRPVEVQDDRAVRHGRRDLQRPVGGVRRDAAGRVGEQDVQAAGGGAVEGGQRE